VAEEMVGGRVEQRLPTRDRRELRRRRSGRGDGAVVGPRTQDFKRRFKLTTSHTPIAYVQQIRVERAKRLLETSDEPIEEISWAVGYEDPASFRRLFKRLTGLMPGAYRQRFQIPPVSAPA
jgi:transcriptional regulator GlxA family with amidase domain